tara:strand:+ start:873 stop:989 length:117 start_codon:yes stop_codon:yes gene_type:complete
MIKDITFEEWKEKVFDVDNGKIVNKSDKPILVKFYADW